MPWRWRGKVPVRVDRTSLGEGGAWLLACLPPALACAERVPDALGAPAWAQAALMGAGGLGYAALLRRDVARVASARPHMPRGVANLVVPLYLARRAAWVGRGRLAVPAWFVAMAITLAASPLRIRPAADADPLPACDAAEIVAVLPGYAARDGGAWGTPDGRPVEVGREGAGRRSCVALLRFGGVVGYYAFTLSFDGADVAMSGTVGTLPDR